MSRRGIIEEPEPTEQFAQRGYIKRLSAYDAQCCGCGVEIDPTGCYPTRGYHNKCRPCKGCGAKGPSVDPATGYHDECRPCRKCGMGQREDGTCALRSTGYHYDCLPCKDCGLAQLPTGRCVLPETGLHYGCFVKTKF